MDWNEKVGSVKVELSLKDIQALIRSLGRKAERELIYELLCDWDDSEQEKLKQWLDE